MNYLDTFVEILENKVGKKEITLETNLRSLGIDSLDLVEIVMDLEDKFEIEFSNEELNEFKTVSDVIDAIEKRK